MSHDWARRIWRSFRLQDGLIRWIQHLLEVQYAVLIFAGLVFQPAQWQCGFRQGGPFSALIFVVIVAPFLVVLSTTPGVRKVFGFCDDWEASITGLAPVSRVHSLVREFEAASRQSIHRTKTKWIPNRKLTSQERSVLHVVWPNATIAERDIVLGIPFGHGVGTNDFAYRALGAFNTRLVSLCAVRMSLSMRIFTANTFLLSLFSYVSRILIMPQSLIKTINNIILRYISPVPFCTTFCFSSLRKFIGISTKLRDFQLD